MKLNGRLEVQLHEVLILELVGDEWSASYPCHFTPREGPHVSTGYKAWWAPEPVLMWW